MIPGKLCSFRSIVFGETFCYVASASDVEGAVRAGEDVDEGVPAYRSRCFSRWEVGKVVSLGHNRWFLLIQSGSPFDALTLAQGIRRAFW
jgi:hypothetical protein